MEAQKLEVVVQVQFVRRLRQIHPVLDFKVPTQWGALTVGQFFVSRVNEANQMPRDAFQHRTPENVPGKYYVSDQCLDCDLCRETAPTVFARHDAGGYSYVRKQPDTPEELALVRECLVGCCVETIHDDGDNFDWQAIAANAPFYLTPEGQALRKNLAKKLGSCCREKADPNGANESAL